MTSPVHNIKDPDASPRPVFALFALGFRPFFLLAGIAATFLVPLWIHRFLDVTAPAGYYDPLSWHAHEMLFGYSVAVIAGFLLTAAHNWTGLPTLAGKPLAALALLWLAARVLPFFAPQVAPVVIASVDMLFLPLLALALAIPLLRSRQWQQLVFLPVLVALSGANLMVHLQQLGLSASSASTGIKFALYLVLLLIVILGGRVIPFFTDRGLEREVTRRWKLVEGLSIGSLLLLAILDLLDFPAPVLATIAATAALAHALRLYGWYQSAIWRVPMLWILQLAYAWLVLGLVLQALAAAGLLNPMLALHAHTLGAIGGMTLGMMARVSLGHSGREINAACLTIWVFVLINLAALVRVLLPIVDASRYSLWLQLSAILWTLAFALFVLGYAPILMKPRVDGRPG